MSTASRYRLKKKGFEGATSDVQICEDRLLRRDVVIKYISDLDEEELIYNEINRIRDLESKHIVQIFDLIDEEDAIGIVEELVDGEDIIAHNQSHPDETLTLLYQLCSAVEDIHSAGVVHRDLKPSNIKVDSLGILKVFDFGLSTEEGDHTHMGRGTTTFKAPELFGDRPVAIEPSQDIYALGVTIWALLSGDIDDVPSALKETPPQSESDSPSFSEIAPEAFTEELINLLDQTLDPDPVGRPSASRLKDEVQRILLFGRHRAVFNVNGDIRVIDRPGRRATIRNGEHSLQVRYTGDRLVAFDIQGFVSVNNTRIRSEREIPNAAVLTLGPPEDGSDRRFVSVHVSHPEVVL